MIQRMGSWYVVVLIWDDSDGIYGDSHPEIKTSTPPEADPSDHTNGIILNQFDLFHGGSLPLGDLVVERICLQLAIKKLINQLLSPQQCWYKGQKSDCIYIHWWYCHNSTSGRDGMNGGVNGLSQNQTLWRKWVTSQSVPSTIIFKPHSRLDGIKLFSVDQCRGWIWNWLKNHAWGWVDEVDVVVVDLVGVVWFLCSASKSLGFDAVTKQVSELILIQCLYSVGWSGNVILMREMENGKS